LQPHDVHPSGYYLVMHGWIGIFGDSPVSLRLPSLIFGIASFFMLYFIINYKMKFKEDSVGFFKIFGSLFVMASIIIYYSTEARMYMMGLFFCLLSFYSMMKFFDGNKKWMLPFILSTAILPYIHYYTAFFIMGELMYTFLFFRKKLKCWLMWPIIFLLQVPVFIYFFMQLGRISSQGWFQTTGFESILSTFYYSWFHTHGGAVSDMNTWFGLVFLLLSAVLIITSFKGMTKNEKRFTGFLALFYLLPPLIGMFINIFVIKLYHHRFFFFTGWIFIFLLAWAFWVHFRTLRRDLSVRSIVVVFSFVLIFMFILSNLVTFYQTANVDLREVSGYINGMNCSETNIIIHESQFSNVPSLYYTDGTCYENYVYADLDEKQLNAVGGDIVNRSHVLHNISDINRFTSFYYLRFSGLLEIDGFNYTDKFESGGLYVVLAEKKPMAEIIIKLQ